MQTIKTNNSYRNFYEEYAVSMQDSKSLINIRKEHTHEAIVRRVLDIILSLICLTITLPLILFTALLIKIESQGPILYVQQRVGHKGKYFNMYKLRSMRSDAESNGPKWAEKNDNRVTKIGGLIRICRIDELPQLINVLIGDMSFIGPRPERPFFTAQFHSDIPDFLTRLSVKPGLTGWAQVNGGYDITPSEKLLLDLYYVENKSFKLDVIIIIKTLKVIFTGEGAR